MEGNMQAGFTFIMPSYSNNQDRPALERLHRMIRELQDMPNCEVHILQMVQITGEPDRVEHARRLFSPTFYSSNPDKRVLGA